MHLKNDRSISNRPRQPYGSQRIDRALEALYDLMQAEPQSALGKTAKEAYQNVMNACEKTLPLTEGSMNKWKEHAADATGSLEEAIRLLGQPDHGAADSVIAILIFKRALADIEDGLKLGRTP